MNSACLFVLRSICLRLQFLLNHVVIIVVVFHIGSNNYKLPLYQLLKWGEGLNDEHQLISSLFTAARFSFLFFGFRVPVASCVHHRLFCILSSCERSKWLIAMCVCVCKTRLISVNDASGVQTWTYCQRLTSRKWGKHWTMKRNKL